MREKTTHGSWRAPVHTTLRFLGRLKHRVTKKWDKVFAESFGLISPDYSPPSPPPPPTYEAPSFPHPVPPFPQPAPPWYTGQHDHEASGSNQNSEYFDSVASLEYAGQLQLQPDYYFSQFHPSFLDNAAQQGELVFDEALNPIDDLLDNDLYFSGELVFSESAVTSQVTETETTTIQQGMSIDTAESMEREAVMDTGASPAGAGRDRSGLLATPRVSVGRGVRRVAVAPYEPLRCKGITQRESGNWNAEIRVSMTKVKVWLGTYATMAAAKLAYDVGLHHCSEKEKPFHFKHLVHRLGPSLYQRVYALCHGDDPHGKQQACSMVKNFALAHAQFAAHCNQ